APVKEPFMWPKSRLSRSVSGSAPQLTGRKSLSRRSESAWIARAINSFPLPLSPVIRTVACVGATFRAISRRTPGARLLPTICPRSKSAMGLNALGLLYRLREKFSNRPRAPERDDLQAVAGCEKFRVRAEASQRGLELLALHAGGDAEILHRLGDF